MIKPKEIVDWENPKSVEQFKKNVMKLGKNINEEEAKKFTNEVWLSQQRIAEEYVDRIIYDIEKLTTGKETKEFVEGLEATMIFNVASFLCDRAIAKHKATRWGVQQLIEVLQEVIVELKE